MHVKMSTDYKTNRKTTEAQVHDLIPNVLETHVVAMSAEEVGTMPKN